MLGSALLLLFLNVPLSLFYHIEDNHPRHFGIFPIPFAQFIQSSTQRSWSSHCVPGTIVGCGSEPVTQALSYGAEILMEDRDFQQVVHLYQMAKPLRVLVQKNQKGINSKSNGKLNMLQCLFFVLQTYSVHVSQAFINSIEKK